MPSFSLPFSNTLLLEFSAVQERKEKFCKSMQKSAMFALVFKDKLNFERFALFIIRSAAAAKNKTDLCVGRKGAFNKCKMHTRISSLLGFVGSIRLFLDE